MKGITLFVFGGVAEMETEPPTATAEFRMAIVGPLMSVAIGATAYVAYLLGAALAWPAAVLAVFSYLAFINVALAIFNMLPAFPLDGGRVLRGYLWSRSGNLRRSTRTASRIGAIFGTGLIIMGLFSLLMGNLIGGIWWFLIGMFLRGASLASYRQLEIRHALEGEPVSRFMKEEPVMVPASATLQRFVDEYVYQHYHDMFPVVDGSRFAGCITTRALKRVPREEWRHRTVGEIAETCTENSTISPDTDAVEALATMSRAQKSRLLVAQNGQITGVITLKDLLAFLALKLDLEEGAESPQELREAVMHR
jgi:CBS domain-containing protein